MAHSPPPIADLKEEIALGVEKETARRECRAVLVRLVVDDTGNLNAEPVPLGFECARLSVEAALRALADFVRELFIRSRTDFTPDEWSLLMGTGPGTSDVGNLPRRFELLARVLRQRSNLDAYTHVTFADFRHHGRLITLPDGTPFSVQLLFPDGRGHHASGRMTPFQSLPFALQLRLIRECWETARTGGRAPKLIELLRHASEVAGDAVHSPDIRLTEDEAGKERDRLREKLQYHDREELYKKLGLDSPRGRGSGGGR